MSNPTLPHEIWDHQVTAIQEASADWLWHGFLARGNLTLLTSMWKAGKTTLLSLLLSRRKHGGSLAGLPVQPGKTVVVSEESTRLWADRARRYDFGGQVCFFLQPFHTIPTLCKWQALVDRIAILHHLYGIDLVAIDPLAPYLRDENQARNILEALLPLDDLTRLGLAVLVLHHPRKTEARIGQSARGSGALLGHVDISIEMRHPGGDPLTRRRRFLALSRHDATPRQLTLEFNQEGTDYLTLADNPDDPFQANWDLIRMVLEDAPRKLTRQDILHDWPPDFDKPNPGTLSIWLNRALDRALLAREGTGRKSNPFRFWLPEREATWKQDPLYDILEQQRQDTEIALKALQEWNSDIFKKGQ
jgi:hypothetical protein